jgi:hypothetical protein
MAAVTVATPAGLVLYVPLTQPTDGVTEETVTAEGKTARPDVLFRTIVASWVV